MTAIDQEVMYSLAFNVEPDLDGEMHAVDWDDSVHAWQVSSREYFGRSWTFEGTLEQDVLGERAYQQILESFGLDVKEFPMQVVERMHPSLLARVGTKDPLSFTLGDHRKASEVRFGVLVAA